MASSFTSSSPPDNWSQCSKDQLTEGFTAHNLDHCLLNIPSTSVMGQTCGDGILEGDEECDCGGVMVRLSAITKINIESLFTVCAAIYRNARISVAMPAPASCQRVQNAAQAMGRLAAMPPPVK